MYSPEGSYKIPEPGPAAPIFIPDPHVLGLGQMVVNIHETPDLPGAESRVVSQGSVRQMPTLQDPI
jgi:hypothetical protein